MQIIRTASFLKNFKGLPIDIKRRTEKVLILLATNPFHPFHPSLHIKKIKGEVIKGFSNVFEGVYNHIPVFTRTSLITGK